MNLQYILLPSPILGTAKHSLHPTEISCLGQFFYTRILGYRQRITEAPTKNSVISCYNPPMGFEIYILDLLGTATFAFYGSYVGIRRKFDIFGIAITGFLTAVGGGTVRAILLNKLPSYFTDMHYIIAIFLGILLSVITYPLFSKINKYALIVDAVGLVTFAFLGATVAHDAGLGAFGIIILATITAIGGGLLRDIAIAETPQIFYQDFYASPAIFLGVLYVIFLPWIDMRVVTYAILLAAFLLRLTAIYFNIHLWGPWRNAK